MRRYLFGPVSKAFADQNLHRQRQAGECLAFDAEGSSDLAIGPEDSWAQVCARLPTGWRPDFIVLYLPYTHIPSCLWQVEVPLVGLALDWPLLWHYYRRRLRSLDWVLTDAAGVEKMRQEGILHARAANLHGCERRFVSSQSSVVSSQEGVSSQPSEGVSSQSSVVSSQEAVRGQKSGVRSQTSGIRSQKSEVGEQSPVISYQ